MARIAAIRRVTRLSRDAQVQRFDETAKMALLWEVAPEGVLNAGGVDKTRFCHGPESATGEEYLSKSEGFSAYRLPFQGALS